MSKTDLIQQALGFHEQIYGLINDYGYKSWLSLDLSIGQLKSLTYVRHKGKANHRELAKVLNVTPSVVTGIVNRLESSGLLARQVDDTDRRVYWLALTEHGNEIFNQFDQKSHDEITQVLSTLKEVELKALVDSFNCFLNAFKKHMEKSQQATEN